MRHDCCLSGGVSVWLWAGGSSAKACVWVVMRHLASAGAQGCQVGWGGRQSLTPGTLTVKQWGEHWIFGAQCLLSGNWGVSLLLGPQRYLCPPMGLAFMALLLNLPTFLCIWGQGGSLGCSLQAESPPFLTSLGDLALCFFCQDAL